MAGGFNAGRSLGTASGSIIINTDSLGRAEVTARRVGQNVTRSLGGINGGARQATQGLSGMGRQLSSTAVAGRVLAGVLAGIGVRALVSQFASAVSGASDLNETISKTGAVFRESTQDILNWSKNSATAFGLSRQAALESASSIGNMFDQLGASTPEAARLSKQMVELAADFASFHNVAGGTEEVLVGMMAAFRGEYDALQRYVPTITAAAVEQQALAETGKDNARQLSALEKAYAAQSIMVRDAGMALGDFERTSFEAANQQRILGAQLTDVATTVGQAFLPAYREVLRTLNQIVADVAPYAENIMASFAGGLARAINTYIVPALSIMRQIFTFWLSPGSPPKLLPKLDEWGAGAMQAYLQGWTNADFSVFDDLATQLESVIRSFAGSGAIPETDLVSQIFGSREAIRRATAEFRTAGSVSMSTLDAIERAAGPAGDSIRDLVRTYFDLQGASRAAARAQEELTRVTAAYDAALGPINDKLRAVQSQQADIRDQQRAAELNAEIADINTTAGNRRLAQLELEELQLRRQQRLLEDERDTAVGAAEDKVDAARKEEAAKQSAYNRQQSIMQQQVDANRLIAEEAALRERLANEALAAQERAMRELEAAQREMQAADEQRRAELERIYQAQLDYNMQIADTPGKIALLKLELQRYTEGSAEYYGILTQIAALEQQMARERESGAAGLTAGADPTAAFGGLQEAAGETRKEYDLLAESVRNMWKAVSGQGDELAPGQIEKGLSSPAQAKGGMSGWMGDLMGKIEELTEAMQGFLGYLDLFFGNIESKADTSGGNITALLENRRSQWLNILDFFVAAFKGDWQGMWDALVRQSELSSEENRLAISNKLEETNTTLGERLAELSITFDGWLTDTAERVEGWGAGFYEAGRSAIENLWDGITSYWDTVVVPGWQAKTQWLRDLLPGSEPRNPQSPLRDLGDAGAAILDNLMAGMDRRSLTLSPTTGGALAAQGAQMITNNYFAFDQQFSTQPDWSMTRNASMDGVRAAMRVRGG